MHESFPGNTSMRAVDSQDARSTGVKESTYMHPVFVIGTALWGLALAGCGTSPPSGASAVDAPAFCTLYRATNDIVDTAFAQITPAASAQTVQSALDTIVTQFKAVVDASPPATIKIDLQTMHTSMVQAQGQLAAVGYRIAQLPGGPPAVNNPEFGAAARNVANWGHTNCGTPPQTGSSPSSPGPTR